MFWDMSGTKIDSSRIEHYKENKKNLLFRREEYQGGLAKKQPPIHVPMRVFNKMRKGLQPLVQQ